MTDYDSGSGTEWPAPFSPEPSKHKCSCHYGAAARCASCGCAYGPVPPLDVQRLEYEVGLADHGSIEGGPDFARGMRYVLAEYARLAEPGA